MQDPSEREEFTPAGYSIKSLTVTGLFGRYSYDPAVPPPPSSELSRLSILYGDNGTGKTTILRALFHLLSFADNKGHRGALSEIPFQKVEIGFHNGVVVGAERKSPSLGAYDLVLLTPSHDLIRTHVTPDGDGGVARKRNPQLEPWLEQARAALPVDVFFITDDRLIEGDNVPIAPPQYLRARREMHQRLIADLIERPIERQSELEATLDRSARWLNQQAFRGASVGSQGSNAIYTDVLLRIATTHSPDQPRGSAKAARGKLDELLLRNSRFSRFGLLPPLEIERLIPAMSKLPPEREDAFLGVIELFIAGLEARMDALAPLCDALTTYVDSLNDFYVDKRVEVSLTRGITITTDDGTELAPSALSSGERQLLLVLTNTLFAQEKPGIFVIDEPELSLNMKWQRKLVDALLSITRGTASQFLLATHSFEVMASARERVVHLVPLASQTRRRRRPREAN